MSHRLLFVLVGALAALTATSAPAAASGDGILLLAHGGKAQWNDNVNALAASIDTEIPVEVAFGMATRSEIQGAVDRLVARRVSRIVAVPLFISSHSTVITSTEYLLGLRSERPAALERFARMSHGSGGHGSGSGDGSGTGHGSGGGHTAHGSGQGSGQGANHGSGHGTGHGAVDPDALRPVDSPVPIVMSEALNAHPLVADILASRAASISTNPAHEAVILVAHGPVSDEDNARWLADMTSLANRVDAATTFASIDYLTVRDDAPAPVRDQATAELRALVARRAAEGRRVLIVPLLLTFGGIEQGIRERLAGLDHVMADQGLLPDERLREWVKLAAASRAQDSTPRSSRSQPSGRTVQR